MKFVDFNGYEYNPSRWLTFNDVLLRPQRSRFRSRNGSDISLNTCLGHIVRDELDHSPTNNGKHPSLDALWHYPHPSLVMGLPIISANMDTVTGEEMAKSMCQLGGLGILHRFYKTKAEYIDAIGDVASHCGRAAFSVGCGGEWIDFAKRVFMALSPAELIVCLDIAHAHADQAIETVEGLRAIEENQETLAIIAGNVATGDGAYELAKAGANCVKCGVGSGSLCTTRLVTGAGVPQLSAIMDVRNTLNSYGYENVGIIADGGIRHAGDIVKSLAAGADAVMVGQLFAGTDESPGEILTHSDNSRTKRYRGQSSKNFMEDIGKNGVAAEGIHIEIPYKGSVKNIVTEMVGGIRSGLTYSGAGNIQELRENAVFQEISEQGWIESIPHATLTVR